MSCDACNSQIRHKYNVHNNRIYCNDCGYVAENKTLLGVYVGMRDYFHVFNFDRPHYCPGCGRKGRSFYFPCNDVGYFDLNELTVNLNNKEG